MKTAFTFTTQRQLRAAFWEMLRDDAPELAIRRRPGRQNDQPTDIRVAWVDWLDNVSRSGDASEQLISRATL
jgi:hypothetical protein